MLDRRYRILLAGSSLLLSGVVAWSFYRAGLSASSTRYFLFCQSFNLVLPLGSVVVPLSCLLHRDLEELGLLPLFGLHTLSAAAFLLCGYFGFRPSVLLRGQCVFVTSVNALIWLFVLWRFSALRLVHAWLPAGPLAFLLFCTYIHRDIAAMNASLDSLRKVKYPFKKL